MEGEQSLAVVKGDEAYLVSKTLRGNDGNLVAYSLVGLKVEGEFWIVALDDDFGRLLNGLQTTEISKTVI